jgi:hypothetical protein
MVSHITRNSGGAGLPQALPEASSGASPSHLGPVSSGRPSKIEGDQVENQGRPVWESSEERMNCVTIKLRFGSGSVSVSQVGGEDNVLDKPARRLHSSTHLTLLGTQFDLTVRPTGQKGTIF